MDIKIQPPIHNGEVEYYTPTVRTKVPDDGILIPEKNSKRIWDLKWFKALHLYFKMSRYRYYYRRSTNEWVLEVTTDIPIEYICTASFPHKYKSLCKIVWFTYFWHTIQDLCEYV